MLIRGDARAIPLADACVDCCVTSPPYWGLRNYGDDTRQIGREERPEDFVASLVAVFRNVRRVLKPTGTLWLNLGDSYFGDSPVRNSARESFSDNWDPSLTRGRGGSRRSAASVDGLKPKDLVGIPWMVAFALRSDGWYLRADIVWAKTTHMPESVRDRPTRSHEYVFLLSKESKYFYDADAIAERSDEPVDVGDFVESFLPTPANGKRIIGRRADIFCTQREIGQSGGGGEFAYSDGKRNKRSVWQLATGHYKGAHFATFPEKLIEPCILAGCPVGGLVLDPFVGSGTTISVANRLGRRAVGIDLGYHELSRERSAQRGLFSHGEVFT